MSFDMFLKIDGIDGETTDKLHPNEIQISAFSWGVANAGSSSSGSGGGTGKAVLQDFSFSAATSKASPNLMLACATGFHINQALLTCRRSGNFEFLKIKLSDVLVSSYAIGGSDTDDSPNDNFSLNFAKIDMLYTVQRTGEVVETGFQGS
jgi:type VI secretion system secreted protein Hcp